MNTPENAFRKTLTVTSRKFLFGNPSKLADKLRFKIKKKKEEKRESTMILDSLLENGCMPIQ